MLSAAATAPSCVGLRNPRTYTLPASKQGATSVRGRRSASSAVRVMAEAHGEGASTSAPTTLKKITKQAVPLTAEAFKPFGQVIGAEHDGKHFDDKDAKLVLDRGTPRFYIMNLPRRGLKFHRITFHANVTQCLGALTPVGDWYMGVARPSGGLQNWPKPEDITVFKIPHGCYVKMEMGTWHAGPLFADHESMSFYNLELSDTNVTDHNTHDYGKSNGWEFEVLPPPGDC